MVMVAAWFCDLGYYTDTLEHQQAGAELARSFLQEEEAEEVDIKAVTDCLLATKPPQNPTTLLEQIVCDAQLYYLVSDKYTEKAKLLRKETQRLHQTQVDKTEWTKQQVQWLASHQFHTEYFREHQSKRKQLNIELLNKKLTRQQAGADPGKAELKKLASSVKKMEEEGKDKGKKSERPDRTIETMFRVTTTNSQRLSDQADSKANIMISVNSFLIPATFFLLRDIGVNSYLTVPLLILLSVSLLTMIFAVLATRPQIPKGEFTQEELDNKKVDLLFFGNFYRMNFEDYSNGMFRIMEDRYFLHLTLLRDLYGQGIVLGRKYRMLTFAYNIFMFGLILSVLAFFVAMKFKNQPM